MGKSYFIVGGDARQCAMRDLLCAQGQEVASFGLERDDRLDAKRIARLAQAEIVLLPLPAADEHGNLRAPYMNNAVPMELVWPLLHREQIVFGGMLSERLLKDAAKYDIAPVDYQLDEAFVLHNAHITAECAVHLTVQKLQDVLRGKRCLVLGYGRIGKFLARLLACSGCAVTVAVRRREVLTQAELDGYKTCDLRMLPAATTDADIIYNTIPHLVADRAVLGAIPKTCFCMDLASQPGGFDYGAAEEMGIQVLRAKGLPGAMAPKAAGKAILRVVERIMAEKEGKI